MIPIIISSSVSSRERNLIAWRPSHTPLVEAATLSRQGVPSPGLTQPEPGQSLGAVSFRAHRSHSNPAPVGSAAGPLRSRRHGDPAPTRACLSRGDPVPGHTAVLSRAAGDADLAPASTELFGAAAIRCQVVPQPGPLTSRSCGDLAMARSALVEAATRSHAGTYRRPVPTQPNRGNLALTLPALRS